MTKNSKPPSAEAPLNDRLLAAAGRLRPGAPKLADLLIEAVEELNDLERTFAIRWEADIRAIKRWQRGHPERGQIWPEHADLVLWLLEQQDVLSIEKKTK